jgi:hypothetical protein
VFHSAVLRRVLWLLCAHAGSVPGIPLHEAWAVLLDGFMPFLADEAEFMADVLLMFRCGVWMVGRVPASVASPKR